MLRFRIGSIPVEVRPSHLLIAALLAWSWLPAARAAESGRMLTAIAAGGFVVFLSILVHELGHAVAARAFGYQPHIVIEWFGGHTAPNAQGPIPWHRDVILTFAGPLFGFLLGVAAGVTAYSIGVPLDAIAGPRWPLHHQVLWFFFYANLLWAVLNLIPVQPLDGGRISNAVLTRLFGRPGVLLSHGLSLLICVVVVAFGVAKGQPFLAIFFGLWGWSALQVVTAYFRGESTPGAPHPADLAFIQAATLFNEQKLGEARAIAERTLADGELPKKAKTRLHHLLGWISIREGRGEEALDHFSRLTEQEAEPQALAAAYALAGDDERALPLWELAFRQTQEASVLHEWAGTLIRLGRTDEAKRLPGVNLRHAFRAAETPLVMRGDFHAAAEVGLRALEEVPAPEIAYDTACSLAKAGRLADAQTLLERALQLGFRDASHAEGDPDLAALRHTPAFAQWLSRVRNSAGR